MSGLTAALLVLLGVYIVMVAGYLLLLSRSVRALEAQAGAADGAKRRRLTRGMRIVLIGMAAAEIALLFGTDRVDLPLAGWVLWAAAMVITFLASVQIDWDRRALRAEGRR